MYVYVIFYCRVVQRNLVFVVGLSKKLADPETLKKHEYFGKFGKIHKVVINQSTSYAGAQVYHFKFFFHRIFSVDNFPFLSKTYFISMYMYLGINNTL